MLVLNEASLRKCRILVNGMSKLHLIFLKLVYILSISLATNSRTE